MSKRDYVANVEVPLALTAIEILEEAEKALTNGTSTSASVFDTLFERAERYLRLIELRRALAQVMEDGS